MSKTVSTCICETNLLPNNPQENVFFHSLYRQQAEFASEFVRTARSTLPIQICALFSTQGPDNLAALLNLELNKELAQIVANVQKNSVLDFDMFSRQVINVLNVKVCEFVVNHNGTQLKTSMTLLVIEGDTLRIITVGNTKAVLVRDSRIFSLTEEHTVARRYVKMGVITPEQEMSHPDNMTLTQYLGRMPQDGEVLADTKVHLKLKENDELCLMGVGIAKMVPPQIRNTVLVKPTTTEIKCKELVNATFNYGAKVGLTAIVIKIESVFLLPGDAVFGSTDQVDATKPSSYVKNDSSTDSSFNSNSDSTSGETKSTYIDFTAEVNKASKNNSKTSTKSSYKSVSDATKDITFGDYIEDEIEDNDDDSDFNGDTTTFNPSKLSPDSVETMKKPKKKFSILDIIIPLIILAIFTAIGYFATYMMFNGAHLLNKVNSVVNPEDGAVVESGIMYSINDNVPVYADESLDSTVIASLNYGDAVTRKSFTDSFSSVLLANGLEGYVLNVQLSEENPIVIQDPNVVENVETEAVIETNDNPTEVAPVDSEPQQTEEVVTEETIEMTTETTAAATEATTAAPVVAETTAATEATTQATEATTAATEATTAATEATTQATEAPVTEATQPAETTAAPTEPELPAESLVVPDPVE